MDNDPLTTQEAAQLLGVDASTVARWCDAGDLDSFRTPGNHRRITPQSVRALIARGRPEATPRSVA